MASDAYRDLGGGITDPSMPVQCSWRCDGETGMSRDPNPADRIPVPCPVHRPHLVHYMRRARRSHAAVR